MNKTISETWIRYAEILISETKALCEASHDGREVPEWLKERLEEIEDVLGSL